MQIKEKSWHFWLVNKIDPSFVWYIENDRVNSCQYVRRVMLCCLKSLLLGIVGGTFAASLTFSTGCLIAWFFAGLFFGFVELGAASLAACIFLVLVCLLIVGAVCVAVDEGYFNKPKIAEKIDIPFISEAYSGFKEKYCTKVELI